MGVPSLKILITKPQTVLVYWCACVVAEQYVRIRFSYGRKINLSLFAFRAGRTAKQFRWTCQIPRLKTKAPSPARSRRRQRDGQIIMIIIKVARARDALKTDEKLYLSRVLYVQRSIVSRGKSVGVQSSVTRVGCWEM